MDNDLSNALVTSGQNTRLAWGKLPSQTDEGGGSAFGNAGNYKAWNDADIIQLIRNALPLMCNLEAPDNTTRLMHKPLGTRT